MSASMLNLSALAGWAQPGAAGKAGAAAQGPLAGFEALMAAFFGAQSQGDAAQLFAPQAGKAAAATVATSALAAEGGKPGEAATAETVDDAKTDATPVAVDPAAGTDANLALLAALTVPAPAQSQVATTQPVVAEGAAGGQAAAPAAQSAATADPQALFDLAADGQGAAAPQLKDVADAAAAKPANALAQAQTPQTVPAASAAPAPAPAPAQPLSVDPPPAAPQAPAAQPLVQAEAAPAPVAAPPAPVKDKAAPRGERADGARAAAPRAEAALHAAGVDRPGAASAPAADGAKPEVAAAAADQGQAAAALEPEVAAAHDADQPAQPAPAAEASAPAPAPAQAAATPVRGSPETVANMAAQIIKKLDARSTRFDLELDPAGLGRVDVRLEINAHGRLSAAMAFDNPQAASELKARANELQKALEQAGFDLSGGMTFDVAGDQGRPGQGFAGQAGQERDTGASFRGRAFQAALDTAGEADAAPRPLNLRRGVSAGLDVRI